MTFSRSRNLPALLSRFPFLEEMDDEMNLLQNWSSAWPSLLQGQRLSGIAIKSDNEKVTVQLDMPGLTSDQIEISLDNNSLFVKGEVKEEKDEKKGGEKIYCQTKRFYSYRVPLPEQIDTNKEPIANYNNGVLKVTLPKAMPNQTKQIKVQQK